MIVAKNILRIWLCLSRCQKPKLTYKILNRIKCTFSKNSYLLFAVSKSKIKCQVQYIKNFLCGPKL